MAARRTDVHQLQEVVRLHRMGVSRRRIARDLRMSRTTISRALEAFGGASLLEGDPSALPQRADLRHVFEAAYPSKRAPQQVSSVTEWRDDIERLRKKGARPTAIHDWLRLNQDGYKGSLSAVKRMCLRLDREAGPRPQDVAIPVETVPGEVAQVDFVYAGRIYDPERGELRRAWLFVMVLGFSRHMYADFVFDQKAETWIRLHVDAFTYFGGVPEVVVPDNLKAAVIRAAFGVDDEVALNRSYRELARYYGCRIDPTPPRSPEKKGKVERAGSYVKHNFLATHTSVDIEADRKALWRWLEEIAATRRHGTTGKRPGEVFETIEREALRPLPTDAYEVVIWKRATLHRDSHVQVDGAFYSAPWKLLHELLDVKVTARHVALHHKEEHLWTHAKVARGRRQTVESHLPEERRELRQRSRSYWLTKASALGPDCRRLAEAIFDADDVIQQLRKVQAVVRHLERHPRERANAASRRALHYGSLNYMAVKNILLKGLDLEPLDGEGEKRDWASGSRFARNPAQTLLAFKERHHDDAD
jgi:transposase